MTQEGDVDLTGSATVTGAVTATEDVGAAGVSLAKHLHDVLGSKTDKPIKEADANA